MKKIRLQKLKELSKVTQLVRNRCRVVKEHTLENHQVCRGRLERIRD